jgi:cell division protein FtsQ
MEKGKVYSLEDRIPKLKKERRQKANSTLIAYLSVFFLLLLTVVYFQSPMSDIKEIVVSGNRNIDTTEVEKLSGLKAGTSYWKIKTEKVKKRLLNHEEIKTVNIKRSFPNTVVIQIEEYKRMAYVARDGNYFPVLESGKVLSPSNLMVIPSNAPLLIEWEQGDKLQELIAEFKKLQESIINRISEIHHTPTTADPLTLTLYMNDGYEVRVTIRDFAKKMTHYPSIVQELNHPFKGVIHLDVGSYFKAYETEGDVTDESER